MKRLVILTASSYGRLNETGYKDPFMPASPPPPVRGINVMLGGVMLSAIILVIFVLCYCCHRSNRKTPGSASPSAYWRDELPMEIYTVETESCIEYDECQSRRPSTPGPPPPYELFEPVATKSEVETSANVQQLQENSEPPSYEKACQLHRELHITAQGYV